MSNTNNANPTFNTGEKLTYEQAVGILEAAEEVKETIDLGSCTLYVLTLPARGSVVLVINATGDSAVVRAETS
jgi:hypothetical protein